MPLPLDFRPTPQSRSAAEIAEAIAIGGPALIALSGGVDSAVVALLAHAALAEKAHAVTLSGAAVSAEERAAARRTAEVVGIVHETVDAEPLEDARYRSNPSDRCYFCRRVEAKALRRYGETRGIRQFLDGVHRDDLADDRPGLRAMEEAGFQHPLVAAGWRKTDVRAFARAAGLPNWDRPSNACLASRIRHGEPVTAELLHRIEAAETWLHSQGFRRVRVRVAGSTARVVVEKEESSRLLCEPLASEIRRELAHLGFPSVELDHDGFPSLRAV